MHSRLWTATVVLACVALTIGGVAAGTGGPAVVDEETGDASETLVVAQDGSGDYTSIQAAIDDAQAGDTVEVRPGNYSEPLTLDKTITLTAPDGAVLFGADSTQSGTAITIPTGSTADPVIDGFEVDEWTYGLNASGTNGDVVVSDSIVVGDVAGTVFSGADGQWRIENSTIAGGFVSAVLADNTTADWTIRDTRTFGSFLAGVLTSGSTGEWTIRDSTINSSSIGLLASETTGQWRLENVTVEEVDSHAIDVRQSGSDWTIADSEIGPINTSLFGNTQNPLGVGVLANETDGAWTITNTSLTGIPNASVDATDAVVEGDATGNWWGQASGPAPGDCLGNVDCASPLSQPPGGSTPELQLPGGRGPAQDLDGDGAYEDVNGDGQLTLVDVGLLFANRDSATVTDNAARFDFSGDGDFSLVDVGLLFNQL